MFFWSKRTLHQRKPQITLLARSNNNRSEKKRRKLFFYFRTQTIEAHCTQCLYCSNKISATNLTKLRSSTQKKTFPGNLHIGIVFSPTLHFTDACHIELLVLPETLIRPFLCHCFAFRARTHPKGNTKFIDSDKRLNKMPFPRRSEGKRYRASIMTCLMGPPTR